MRNFNAVCKWWMDDNVDVVLIDGEFYALSGWNGEIFINCWKVVGEELMDAEKETYTVKPNYNNGKTKIVGYEVWCD